MVNTRVLGTKSRNGVRCRNRARSHKSDRTPPKAIPLNLRHNHDCVLAEPAKAIPFPASYAKTPKSDRTPSKLSMASDSTRSFGERSYRDRIRVI